MPREELKKLLEAAWPETIEGHSVDGSNNNELGIGLDCCIKKTKFPNVLLVQTTDFFFPLIDDPYVMGQITCSNVLSDLFATGITQCDNMLMLLGVNTEMTERERQIILPLIMRGFSDTAILSGATISGGQTVKNPWMLLGGVATSIVESTDIIPYNAAEVSDVLVLTKPLGTRLICNAYQWYDQKLPRWENIKHILSIDQLIKVYLETAAQMAFLNLESAKEMHNHHAHACTDVTGFGILGHATNLASFQKNPVDFVIHTLPLLEYSKEISEKCGFDFGLFSGSCAETSGGLLIAMPKHDADAFCSRMKQPCGKDHAWIIGDVVSGTRSARISSTPIILSVSAVFK